MSPHTRWLTPVVVLGLALATAVAPAAAHEERQSVFPPGDGVVPTYRTITQAADVLVVCKPDSDARIGAIPDAEIRAFNQELLDDCGFQHLQAAVDAVEVAATNIYVLPGHYREEPSWDPPCTEDYDGGVVEYELMVACGEVVNLVTVAGDDPEDEDIACDNQLCDLQIEGTGDDPRDVVFSGGFREDGDWVKHNGIKADRADGIYLKNQTWELFRENAIYVHETDGYVIDEVVARYNDLYGILTFTADHGVIRDCETHHNGDSGIYPGSASDVHGDATESQQPIERWAVEIFGCDTHHNALGFSGTAGNSVYFHDNLVHHNGAGYVTDSFVSGHPGMPQDHARIEGNRIFANNQNYYTNVQGEDAPCQAERPADRGYERGIVCPVFPVPVGTGILFAGGNFNLVRDNDIYDNWRAGTMQFWVPGALREDFDAAQQFDVAHGNRYVDNRMGIHPSGAVQPNGVSFWWDDQGEGNCWQGNLAATEITSNATSPLGLPDCESGGSVLVAGNVVKSAGLVPCATYNREDEPDPPGCDWFESQPEPEGRETVAGDHSHDPDPPALAGGGAGDEEPSGAPTGDGGAGGGGGAPIPVTGGGALAMLLGVGLITGAWRLRRHRAVVAAA